jgi:hypothetical protein
VEAVCAAEPHLGWAPLSITRIRAAFPPPWGAAGDLFAPGRGRMRVAEHAQAAMGCAPTSNFNLVGAAQVGKGSLSGMRLLHRLPREIAVWPIDPLPQRGKVVVEIYTTLAAMAAGRRARASKIRSPAELAEALAALGCAAPRCCPPFPTTPPTR